jgi:hypothetical protein
MRPVTNETTTQRSAENQDSASPALPLAERSSQDRSVAAAGSPLNNEAPGESVLGGISVRAWLALIIVLTVCIMSLVSAIAVVRRGEEITISEPLYSMAVLALGFYFGQKTRPNA